MPYEIQFKTSAWKVFRKLQGEVRGRVAEAILGLAEDPRPPNAKKLSGKADYYRVRVGDYRVIYEIHENVLVVLVIKIGHRGDVYRRL